MISRTLENNITNLFNLRKVIIILGARQVGKTTLIHQIINNNEDTLIINGDQPDSVSYLQNHPSDRLQLLLGNTKTLVIDEAQLISDIGIIVKRIHDYINDIQIIISGSSSLELANFIYEPLTGRKLEFQLFPISFREMVKHTNLLKEKRLLPHRLVFGYYPEIIMSPGNEITLLKNLSGSYLYKDLLSYGAIKKPHILEKLLKALALQVGSEVSYHELSQIVGADKETIERYIDLLEKAFIVFRLNGLNRSHRNEIKKGKKVYFYDNGIRNAVIGNFQQFEQRSDQGALWENFMISERLKHLSYNEFYGSTYFWRTKKQQEIDYLEEQDGKFKAFEFKLNPKRKARLSTAFSEAYDVDSFHVITPENLEDFLLFL